MDLIPSYDITIMLLTIATGLFIAASIFYFLRLIKDPSIPDMVLAVNVLAYDLAVFIVLFGILCNSPFLAIGSLPLVLWAYLLDMYVSKYLARRELGG